MALRSLASGLLLLHFLSPAGAQHTHALLAVLDLRFSSWQLTTVLVEYG
jgi:hypothetical protein